MGMTLPVVVEEKDGSFVASVLGSPELRATADRREAAVASLRADLDGRMTRGELATIEVASPGRPRTGRRYTPEQEAELLRQMEEAYRERDEEKRQEWPE